MAQKKKEKQYNWAEACLKLKIGGLSRYVVQSKYKNETHTFAIWKKKFQQDKII